MKILVLNGSPKKKSDTFRLTEAFLKGMAREGSHEVNVIDVIDKGLENKPDIDTASLTDYSQMKEKLAMEVVFSPIAYRICAKWKKENVGESYFAMLEERKAS